MSCIYKIREGMASYTSTEKKLADYMLENPNEVTQSSAQILGQQAGVSAAAIVRFSHKLGYKGFTALKVDLARDSADELTSFDDMIVEKDSMAVVIKKAESLNTMLQNQAYRLLNAESLEKAVEVLLKSQNIYLFGVSGSGVVCMDFMEKLSRINYSVIYHNDFHDQLAAAAHMTAQDAVVAVSYSGKTHEVNTAVKYAKEIGTPTIAITQFRNTPLAKAADIPLYIPITERELRIGAIASRNASFIITDLLYLGLAKNNMEQTKEYLVKTRKIVNRLK